MGVLDQFTDQVGAAHERVNEITQLLAQHSQILGDVVDRLDAQLEREEYVRKSGTTQVAADGTAEISLMVNPGHITCLQGFATTAPLAAGTVAFYLGESSNGQNLLHAVAGAQLLSGAFAVGIILPESVALICRFTAQTPGLPVTAAFSGKRLTKHVAVAVPGVPY